MDNASPWLTPVLAFLGAALGGVAPAWISHVLQQRQARNDRRRQALIDLQRALLDHMVTAGLTYVRRGAHFRLTGEWPPLLAGGSTHGAQTQTAYPAHIVARIDDDELRRLVHGLLEAINVATILATTAEEADQAIARMTELNVQSRERIETLLARLP